MVVLARMYVIMRTSINPHAKKSDKVIYRIFTIAIALFILPGIFFINTPMAVEGPRHLGIPDRLALEVGIASFIGGLLIALPWFGSRLKEWAYVGLGIVYLTAFIGHVAIDGWIFMTFTPLIAFAVLLISYICYHKVKK